MHCDDERTDHLKWLGTVLLRAGWSLDLPNAHRRTARQLPRVGQQYARAKQGKTEHAAAGGRGVAAYLAAQASKSRCCARWHAPSAWSGCCRIWKTSIPERGCPN